MYIYAFGSVCRGEIDPSSDIDLLVVINKTEQNPYRQFNMEQYSVYSFERLNKIWIEGNPFAWHLYTEAKFLFSDNGENLLENIPPPSPYTNEERDCKKFYNLFLESMDSLKENPNSQIFDLSMIFLAIRNFASCYSLGVLKQYNFSRFSALKLGEDSLNIPPLIFSILERARILTTRGIGEKINTSEISKVISQEISLKNWFSSLNKKIQYV
ncbi:nucleotidyltransferase domain-containing protein [Aureispira sp. CCB-QB1]|uniref:nucleotidyltransferase domain-containing protein n=1 Tax=Aureispira sp. CCB-QB1 TaxID=1313421 RepID=UPI0006984CF8|nr:nucleotidyltransferase domain-containing protein [Aureispira sp. CCB-QB1]